MQHGQITVCFVEWRSGTGKLTIKDIELDREAAESNYNAGEEHVEFRLIPHEGIYALLEIPEQATLLSVYQWVCRLIIAHDIPG